jgi:serine/threonine-protein kinase
MADVLLARADGGDAIKDFERHVVIKRIKSEHAKNPKFVQMFLDEGRLAATLHHQHIVQVLDCGETDGEYFLAMEYLHGEDVRRLLSFASKKKTNVPVEMALAIASAAAAGLHHAHEKKIVHRDVSPSNIIVGYDGSVKVVDFGIAKAGQLAGKLAYMSPEQIKGDVVDRRSDVWSLGVVLYELATTTRLFKGDGDDASIMDQIIGGKIPLPRIRRPELTNELQTVIMNALTVDPKRRYQTTDEFRAAIDGYAQRTGAVSPDLASYMRRQFGARVMPWLETELPLRPAEHRSSWTELSRTNPPTDSRQFIRPKKTSYAKLVLVAVPLIAAAALATWYFA